MTGQQLLGQFWAVTSTSLYSIHRDERGHVHVVKTAIRAGATSKIAAGITLTRSTFLAITQSNGIFFYRDDWHAEAGVRPPERRQFPENTNSAYWEGGTSPIVALFLEESAARECLETNNPDINDARWKDSTKAVLQALETDPTIIVSLHPSIGFPPNFFE